MRAIQITVFLFAFLLPLHTGASNVALILLIVLLAIRFFRQKDQFKLKSFWVKLGYSTAFVLILIVWGMLSSTHLEDSWHFIEKWISFILIPFGMLCLSKSELLTLKRHFVKGIFFGSVLSIIILLGINISVYYSTRTGIGQLPGILNYYNTSNYFTEPLDIHPTYLGIYYLTALLFVREVIDRIYIRLFAYPLLLISFLFLNSRILFVILLAIALYYGGKVLVQMIRDRKYVRTSLAVALSVIVAIWAVRTISTSYIGFKFRNIIEFELSTQSEVQMNSSNKGNPRMARWISALNLIKEKPILGYGIADEYQNLQEQFKKDGLEIASESRYNSHNQFLGFTIRFGIIGLLFLLGYFVANLLLFARFGDAEFLMVLLAVIAICCFENFLDRNYGITYFAVIMTLFSYISLHRKKDWKEGKA